MDSQLIINSAFGIISVLAGWVFRMVWGRIQELEDDLEDLEKHHEADLKEASFLLKYKSPATLYRSMNAGLLDT